MNRIKSSLVERFRTPVKLELILTGFCVAMGLYHLLSTQKILYSPTLHQNTHLFFALSVVFLDLVKKSRRLWPICVVFLLLSIVSTGYIFFAFDNLQWRLGSPNTPDLIIGIILLVVIFEAVRRTRGLTFLIVGLIGVGYVAFGQYIPGFLYHHPISLSAAITNFAMGLTGIYGTVLGISVKYIFLFCLLGGLLRASGATGFVVEIGKLVGRKMTSGAGMTAVVSSALLGTSTGIAASNVAITGSFTIPMMKKAGYAPHQAGAIEAVSSSGGQIMPPVLAAVGFALAEFTGIPYIKVCAMVLIPALLYYLCVGLYVYLAGKKLRLSRMTEEVDYNVIKVMAATFVLPLVVLVAVLMRGFTPMYAGFWAIVTLLVVSFFRKETRLSLRRLVEGFVEGSRMGAQIGVTCAFIGIVLTSATITGLGIKLPGLVIDLSAGNLFLALGLVGLVTIILGAALPPMASYIMVAIMTIPALTMIGVPKISAHFFIFYLCAFALITPPIGIASVVAATLAKASYWRTSIEALRVGLAAMLMPIIVIFTPSVILLPLEDISISFAIARIVGLFALILMFQISCTGYFLRKVSLLERSLGVVSVAMLGIAMIIPSYVPLAGGLALAIFVALNNTLKGRSVIKSLN